MIKITTLMLVCLLSPLLFVQPPADTRLRRGLTNGFFRNWRLRPGLCPESCGSNLSPKISKLQALFIRLLQMICHGWLLGFDRSERMKMATYINYCIYVCPNRSSKAWKHWILLGDPQLLYLSNLQFVWYIQCHTYIYYLYETPWSWCRQNESQSMSLASTPICGCRKPPNIDQ